MKISVSMLDQFCITNPEPPPADVEAKTIRALTYFQKHGYLEKTPILNILTEHTARLWLGLKSQYSQDGIPKCFSLPQKGLALFGSVGTGKSKAMEILAALFEWEFFTVPALASQYADKEKGDSWLNDTLREYDHQTIILDDLGAETEVKHFGVCLPVADIIAHRYDMWKYYRAMTYLTGNLTGKELLTKYGARTEDRIAEMCEIIPCCWSSFRRKQTQERFQP